MQPKLFFALTAIMAAMAFASCSGDDSTSPTAASSGAAASGVTSAASKAAAPTTGGGSSGGGAAQVPADGCALLSLDEAKKLSPAMAAGKPGAELWANQGSFMQLGVAGHDKGDLLRDAHRPGADVAAGVTSAAVKPSFQAELRDAKENGSEITGVGEYAIYISVIPANGEAKGIVKGLLVIVEYAAGDARPQKDTVIALFKSVAAKIQ